MGRLYGLDALRGIAAIVVLLYHVGTLSELNHMPSGYLAVDFFFVLSGYVMARTYEHRMPSPSQFFWLRYRRLWPMAILGMAIGTPLFLIKDVPGTWTFVALNVFLIPTWSDRGSYPLNNPTWSIFAELAANLAHALVFARSSLRTLYWLCAMFGALIILSAALTPYVAGPGVETGLDIFWAIPRATFGYVIGVILWRRWRDRPPMPAPWPVAATILLAASLLPNVTYWIIPFGAIACPIIIAAGLRWDPGDLGYWLGALSFPLYAVHVPLLRYGTGFGLNPLLTATAAIVVALFLAYLPWKWRNFRHGRSLRLELARAK